MKFKVSSVALVLLITMTACSKKNETAQQETTTPIQQATPQAVAYITHENGPLTLYSLADYSKIGEINVGEGGHGAALTEDGKLLVVAVKKSKDLAVIDTVSNKIVRRIPIGMDPDFVRVLGELVFVTYQPASKTSPTQVAIIDLLKGEKTREITLGLETKAIEFSDDGQHIIVTNQTDENLSVYTIETGEKIKQIDTERYGVRPRSIKRSPDGDHFVVTLEYGNKILILNKEYNVINEATTGEVPFGVTYTRDGSEIVVSLGRGKAVQVFDAETLELKREIPVGDRCWHFSFTPDDKQLVMACGRSNNLMILDYATGNVLKDIPEGNMPWGVMVSPKSVGSMSEPD